MKQFKLTRANGDVRGPFTEDVARGFQTGHNDRHTLSSLEIDFSMIDADGDMWTRLPDLEQSSAGASLAAGAEGRFPKSADERLERVALEYLRILLPAHLNGLSFKEGETVSTVCVSSARDFIAELDAAK